MASDPMQASQGSPMRPIVIIGVLLLVCSLANLGATIWGFAGLRQEAVGQGTALPPVVKKGAKLSIKTSDGVRRGTVHQVRGSWVSLLEDDSWVNFHTGSTFTIEGRAE
jgi:hypothetical protein